MPIERSHGPFINRLELNAFELEPNAKMRDRVKMQPRHVVVVPGPDELLFVVLK